MPLVVVLLGACVSPSSVPRDHYYRLPEVNPPNTRAHSVTDRLGITRIAADGLHSERTILFLDQRQPFELQRYHYHHWTQAPPDLIREHLLHYLRTARVADRVVRYKPGDSVDGIIYGKLIRFERIIDGKDVKVNVSMELGLRTNDNVGHEWEQEYSATVTTQGQTMHDTVLAFGTALEQIYEHFVTDLEANEFKE